jgi:hypothetical protein
MEELDGTDGMINKEKKKEGESGRKGLFINGLFVTKGRFWTRLTGSGRGRLLGRPGTLALRHSFPVRVLCCYGYAHGWTESRQIPPERG